MLDTSQVQVQLFSVTSSNRVEETDALDETAITGVAAVGHDDGVERTLFGTATSETNGYHDQVPYWVSVVSRSAQAPRKSTWRGRSRIVREIVTRRKPGAPIPPELRARLAGDALTADIIPTFFERSLARKPIGAYYTQADVAGYIVRATIIPGVAVPLSLIGTFGVMQLFLAQGAWFIGVINIATAAAFAATMASSLASHASVSRLLYVMARGRLIARRSRSGWAG